MKIINKRKFIKRISELIVLISTTILTFLAIKYATQIRDYKAFGGEYLLPLLGLTIVMILETIYEEEGEDKKDGQTK